MLKFQIWGFSQRMSNYRFLLLKLSSLIVQLTNFNSARVRLDAKLSEKLDLMCSKMAPSITEHTSS